MKFLKSVTEHWQEYLIEAWGLSMFMISAGVFATFFYNPAFPIPNLVPNPFLRGIFMGIAMGITAVLIIYSPWGKRSGAHINPAVTLTFFRLGKLSQKDALFYVLFQFLGGTIGVVITAFLFGNFFTDPPVQYVVTRPGTWGWIAALTAEFAMSFIMMMMVLFTSNINQLSKYTGYFAGILVANYVIFGAPISGFSINPARTFASSFPSGIWDFFWIYYLVPPLAMLTAAEMYLRSDRRPKTLCVKLCPNGEENCIATKCCDNCDRMVRYWREEDKQLAETKM